MVASDLLLLLIFALVIRFSLVLRSYFKFVRELMNVEFLGRTFFIRLPLFLFWCTGIGAVYFYLNNFNEDTSGLSNTLLVIYVALSALTFTFAQTIKDFEDWNIPGRYVDKIDFTKLKSQVFLSGIGFFCASILLILASTLKYLALNPNVLASPPTFPTWVGIISRGLIDLFMGIFFTGSTWYALRAVCDLYLALRVFPDVLPQVVDKE